MILPSIIFTIAFLLSTFSVWILGVRQGYAEIKLLDSLLLSWGALFLVVLILHVYVSPGFDFSAGVLAYSLVLVTISKKNRWIFPEVADLFAPGLLLFLALMSSLCVFRTCSENTLVAGTFYLVIWYVITNRAEVRRIFGGNLMQVPKLWSGVIGGLIIILIALTNIHGLISAIGLSLTGVLALLGLSYERLAKGSSTNQLVFPDFEDRFGSQRKVAKRMINLPENFVTQMKKILKKQEKSISEEMKLLETEDPFKNPDRAKDNAEFITDSSEQQDHEVISSQQKFLQHALSSVRSALDRIHLGTYGLSVKSGRPIAPERLKAKPSAELTIEEEMEKERDNSNITPPMERIN